MANIALVDNRGNYVNSRERSRLYTGNYKENIGIVETIVINKYGLLLTQERGKKKEYAGQIFPFHGGMVDETDLVPTLSERDASVVGGD